MFTFTPLLGAHSSSLASSSLLELDGGIKLLIDIGWTPSFHVSQLASIETHVSTLSCILLTHPTLDHLGAYAHCCKHIPLFSRIPVYATIPVVNLGRALVEDVYASSAAAASVVPASALGTGRGDGEEGGNFLLTPPSAEEIAGYFSAITPLKYSQPHQPIPSPFSPPLGGLTVTAYSAGHTLGGTIWHVQHGLESIVYAADWNQTRENLSPGAAWLSSSTGGAEIIEPLRRPTALVCSARGIERTENLSRRKRDETLISLIRETISQGGKVLIPTDSSARSLELAFVLNQTWRENVDGPHAATYKNAKIYMASKTGKATMRYLQSMLEWMDESVMRDAEAAMTGKGKETTVHPLDWRFIRQIERQSQLDKALRRKNPAVILASDASLEWGYSRRSLQALAKDSRNLVILTEETGEDSPTSTYLGHHLFHHWRSSAPSAPDHSGAKIVNGAGTPVPLREPTIQPLEPSETLLYDQYLARQRQLHSTQQGDNTLPADSSTSILDATASDSSDSSDSDEDVEHQGKALNLSNQMTASHKRKTGLANEDLGINVLIKGKGVYDYDVRHKRGRERIFPHVAPRHRTDDFGDVIKPEEFLRAEERDEVDGVEQKDGAVQDGVGAVGQKRKWEDVAASKSSRNAKGPNKRSKREPDDIDAAIARATGQSLANGTTAASAEGSEDSATGSESDYEPDDTSAAPRKLTYASSTLDLHLRIAHVDYTGLFEKRDLQMLIPLIRPRKLILTCGSASETSALAEECRALLTGDTAAEVFAPGQGESVDASVDTNAWSLKLSGKLVKKLVWQNVKGLGIVALTGQLGVETPAPSEHQEKEGDETARKKLKGATASPTSHTTTSSSDGPLLPVLSPLPLSTAITTTHNHHPQATNHPIHVGDLRIADLRALLKSLGHMAEFRGEGTLLVDGSVVVRKGVDGKIEVESGAKGMSWMGGREAGRVGGRDGGGEGTFWAVRRAVYRGLAVVGGGS